MPESVGEVSVGDVSVGPVSVVLSVVLVSVSPVSGGSLPQATRARIVVINRRFNFY